MDFDIPYGLLLIAIVAVMSFVFFVALSRRYKTCPSNKILVKSGRVGHGRSALPIHGGATLVWPLIQQYTFLDLTPMTIDIPLKGALSKQNIRVNIPSSFTIAISTQSEIMMAAAERLLGLTTIQIQALARDIIFGQLRATIATMEIEAINGDRKAFEAAVMENIESELKKIGIYLINVNISDITDDSGYIEALGRKAAAVAVNRALVDTSQADKNGAEGKAIAEQEQRIAVATNNSTARAGEAAADATAVTSENQARQTIANSEAELREAQAEAQRRGKAAELVKTAAADKDGFDAQAKAQEARAIAETARLMAEVITPARAEKEKLVIEAEAKGDAEKAHLTGLAAGQLEVYLRKAEGIKALVEAAGNDPKAAAMLLIIEQLPEIVKLQTAAIANIDFGKIVVFDGGSNGNAAANWMQGLTQMLPGIHEFAKMAGIELPEYLGKLTGESSVAPAAVTDQQVVN